MSPLTSISRDREQRTSQAQQADVDNLTNRANNVVVQHMNAAEKLKDLEKELERSDLSAAATQSGSTDLVPYRDTSLELMSRQISVIAAFQTSLASAPDPASKQALMIQRSPELVNNLLREWTCLH